MAQADRIGAASAWASDVLGSRVVSREVVQSLWSGYGSLDRLRCADGTQAILKSVAPPDVAQHPRGWNGKNGHARKIRSYEVESAFYEDWSQGCTDACRVPRLIRTQRHEHRLWLLLEDLDHAGFDLRRQRLDEAEQRACLSWLATFHARFLGRSPTRLWPTGTYWHLATRPDELDGMEPGQLRDAAAAIDAKLSACRYPTLVHGDAKVANFCFGPSGVAAVDFQYVGGGCGMKDVAYFLSSILSESECEAHAEAALDTYFGVLRKALPADVDAEDIESEWRGLYPMAWADFHRFLAGWAPTHVKRHGYTARMTGLALSSL